MDRPTAEVARLFEATEQPGNAGGEVFPGYPGYVVADGELRQMTWGFPMAMKGKNGQALKPRPVNNTRADKLDSFFWRFSFLERRCLIPVTSFAEAEGSKGSKTRTWLSIPDRPVFAVAGIWRHTDEWGPAYSMVMTEACVQMGEIHDRMPVILDPGDHQQWTRGSPEGALALCAPYEGQMAVERTAEPWTGRSGQAVSANRQ
jgi:putative SOS response-associated peptidase YedK